MMPLVDSKVVASCGHVVYSKAPMIFLEEKGNTPLSNVRNQLELFVDWLFDIGTPFEDRKALKETFMKMLEMHAQRQQATRSSYDDIKALKGMLVKMFEKYYEQPAAHEHHSFKIICKQMTMEVHENTIQEQEDYEMWSDFEVLHTQNSTGCITANEQQDQQCVGKTVEKNETDVAEISDHEVWSDFEVLYTLDSTMNEQCLGKTFENTKIDEEDVAEISDHDVRSDFEVLYTQNSTMDQQRVGKTVENNETAIPILKTSSKSHLIARQKEHVKMISFRLHRTFSSRGTYYICTLLLLTLLMVHTEGSKWSCNISLETMEFPTTCPKNETDYMQRSKKKACERITQNCTTKVDFKYHCVIDTSGLGFVEVCAPQRSIFGYCAEFNKGGARVQEHYEYGCKKFKEKPCPDAYPSWKCFEYPGCYEAILENMKNMKQAINSTDQQNTTIGGGFEEELLVPSMYFYVFGFTLPVLVMSLIILFLWRCRRNGTRSEKSPRFQGDEDNLMLNEVAFLKNSHQSPKYDDSQHHINP